MIESHLKSGDVCGTCRLPWPCPDARSALEDLKVSAVLRSRGRSSRDHDNAESRTIRLTAEQAQMASDCVDQMINNQFHGRTQYPYTQSQLDELRKIFRGE